MTFLSGSRLTFFDLLARELEHEQDLEAQSDNLRGWAISPIYTAFAGLDDRLGFPQTPRPASLPLATKAFSLIDRHVSRQAPPPPLNLAPCHSADFEHEAVWSKNYADVDEHVRHQRMITLATLSSNSRANSADSDELFSTALASTILMDHPQRGTSFEQAHRESLLDIEIDCNEWLSGAASQADVSAPSDDYQERSNAYEMSIISSFHSSDTHLYDDLAPSPASMSQEVLEHHDHTTSSNDMEDLNNDDASETYAEGDDYSFFDDHAHTSTTAFRRTQPHTRYHSNDYAVHFALLSQARAIHVDSHEPQTVITGFEQLHLISEYLSTTDRNDSQPPIPTGQVTPPAPPSSPASTTFSEEAQDQVEPFGPNPTTAGRSSFNNFDLDEVFQDNALQRNGSTASHDTIKSLRPIIPRRQRRALEGNNLTNPNKYHRGSADSLASLEYPYFDSFPNISRPPTPTPPRDPFLDSSHTSLVDYDNLPESRMSWGSSDGDNLETDTDNNSRLKRIAKKLGPKLSLPAISPSSLGSPESTFTSESTFTPERDSSNEDPGWTVGRGTTSSKSSSIGSSPALRFSFLSHKSRRNRRRSSVTMSNGSALDKSHYILPETKRFSGLGLSLSSWDLTNGHARKASVTPHRDVLFRRSGAYLAKNLDTVDQSVTNDCYDFSLVPTHTDSSNNTSPTTSRSSAKADKKRKNVCAAWVSKVVNTLVSWDTKPGEQLMMSAGTMTFDATDWNKGKAPAYNIDPFHEENRSLNASQRQINIAKTHELLSGGKAKSHESIKVQDIVKTIHPAFRAEYIKIASSPNGEGNSKWWEGSTESLSEEDRKKLEVEAMAKVAAKRAASASASTSNTPILNSYLSTPKIPVTPKIRDTGEEEMDMLAFLNSTDPEKKVCRPSCERAPVRISDLFRRR